MLLISQSNSLCLLITSNKPQLYFSLVFSLWFSYKINGCHGFISAIRQVYALIYKGRQNYAIVSILDILDRI